MTAKSPLFLVFGHNEGGIGCKLSKYCAKYVQMAYLSLSFDKNDEKSFVIMNISYKKEANHNRILAMNEKTS